MTRLCTGHEQLAALQQALAAFADEIPRLERWGAELAERLADGGRLLAAGNGGSAAEAQHLTAELVGRFQDERQPLSAIALTGEPCGLTAIANDDGWEESLARQVRAHGRPGDVVVLLSTSGHSSNVLAGARAAIEGGATVWGLTGPAPNPLAELCHEVVAAPAPATATAQELHLLAVHVLAGAVDAQLAVGRAATPASTTPADNGHPRPERKAAARGGGRRGGERVTVVGDALLDVDLEGSAQRLCPDAPAPVVDQPADRSRPGGAALAARLLADDGAQVTLVTALADDSAGTQVRDLLDACGVKVEAVPLEGATPVKQRVRAGGQTLVRIDRGGGAPAGALPPAATAAIADADAVLVADYGQGLTADEGVRDALTDAARCRPLVWDPHPRGTAPVARTRLVTPNEAEIGRLATSSGEGLAWLTDAALDLRQRWEATAVCATRGARGAALVTGDGTPLAVPAPATGEAAVDTCGAGDRFAAEAARCLARGATLSEAVVAAVQAASAYVATGAAAAAGEAGAGEAPPARQAHASSPEELVAAVHAQGGTVVATGGCFDLLHAGHVRALSAARALGDCLIVCLNSDASARRLKGEGRPLVSEDDRRSVLLGLADVDAVVTFEEDTPAAVLDRLRPDVWAKGGDYTVADLPEAVQLARWGGQAVIVPYLSGHSTSDLIATVRCDT